MSFIKSMVLPNGIPGSYHKIVNVTSTPDLKELEVKVGSWIDRESYVAGYPASWNQYIKIPIGLTIERAESFVEAQEPFVGATRYEEPDDPLEKVKAQKWLLIKTYRDRLEYNGFSWDSSVFDSDPQSQSRIQGGVQLALLAKQNNEPFTINWTLMDNTVRTLTADQMIAVGQALAAHIQTIHETARTIRQQINNATTVQEVQAITWPSL